MVLVGGGRHRPVRLGADQPRPARRQGRVVAVIDLAMAVIVIVGVTARGLGNPVATAVGEQYPHQLQASILETVIGASNISRPYWATVAEIAFSIIITLLSLLIVQICQI